MVQTTSAQMIVPEVWADMVQGEFEGRLVFGQGGFSIADNTLVGVPGATVNFPSWNTLSDITDPIAETTALTPEQFSATPGDSATIQEIGKAVEITDKARLTALGGPDAEARRQLGILVARKIDLDLKTEAESSLHTVTHAGVIDWTNAMVPAIREFGDEWQPDNMAGLVVHSKVHADLLENQHFLSRDKVGDLAVIPRGFVGSFGGVPVVVSDRITKTTGTTPTYKNLLVRRNALGTLYKRRPLVESDRDVLSRSDVITTNVHYAVKLLDDDGVVVLTTQ